jgi:hypothetical protein
VKRGGDDHEHRGGEGHNLSNGQRFEKVFEECHGSSFLGEMNVLSKAKHAGLAAGDFHS